MSAVKALVPMRHHSQRVPGKNYRPLAGKPLFHYILDTLLKVDMIEQVVVDTDSEVIKRGIRENFPEVHILDRPLALSADEISMNEIINHDLSRLEGEFFLQTHSTNPFITEKTLLKAVRTFFDQYPDHDSLFSVTPLHTRLWNKNGQPLNHDPRVLLQTQDLPPVYEENSCLYIFPRKVFQDKDNRIGDRPYLYEISPEEAWDIDTELDFQISDCLMQERRK